MNMKKVIIYGVRGRRRYIEEMLSSNYEVVGYSDSDSLYQKLKWYEYKPFWTPCKLIDAEFDYILVSIADAIAAQQVKDRLICFGIERAKIVLASNMFLTEYDFYLPICDYLKLIPNFDGLCMGMSLSRNAVLTHFLTKKFYKLSYYGADLHYQYKNMQLLMERSLAHISSLKYLILELPYFIFNWDLSQGTYTFAKRIPLLEFFHDYHNMKFSGENLDLIKEFQIVKDMFKESRQGNRSCVSNNFEYFGDSGFTYYETPFYSLENITHKIYPERIKENTVLLERILDGFTSVNANIKVLVFITPQLQCCFCDISEEYEEMKTIYYSVINRVKDSYDIKILDYTKELQQKSLYFDPIHLNGKGALKFSMKIDEDLKKFFY